MEGDAAASDASEGRGRAYTARASRTWLGWAAAEGVAAFRRGVADDEGCSVGRCCRMPLQIDWLSGACSPGARSSLLSSLVSTKKPQKPKCAAAPPSTARQPTSRARLRSHPPSTK
eukprot:4363264-Prymnesium_polylepis.1